jgi:hypothetical protein
MSFTPDGRPTLLDWPFCKQLVTFFHVRPRQMSRTALSPMPNRRPMLLALQQGSSRNAKIAKTSGAVSVGRPRMGQKSKTVQIWAADIC